MTTALETALVVKRDPILEALQQRLRWRTARLRTMAADAELYQRRVRLEERRDRLAQRRKEELERWSRLIRMRRGLRRTYPS